MIIVQKKGLLGAYTKACVSAAMIMCEFAFIADVYAVLWLCCAEEWGCDDGFDYWKLYVI